MCDGPFLLLLLLLFLLQCASVGVPWVSGKEGREGSRGTAKGLRRGASTWCRAWGGAARGAWAGVQAAGGRCAALHRREMFLGHPSSALVTGLGCHPSPRQIPGPHSPHSPPALAATLHCWCFSAPSRAPHLSLRCAPRPPTRHSAMPAGSHDLDSRPAHLGSADLPRPGRLSCPRTVTQGPSTRPLLGWTAAASGLAGRPGPLCGVAQGVGVHLQGHRHRHKRMPLVGDVGALCVCGGEGTSSGRQQWEREQQPRLFLRSHTRAVTHPHLSHLCLRGFTRAAPGGILPLHTHPSVGKVLTPPTHPPLSLPPTPSPSNTANTPSPLTPTHTLSHRQHTLPSHSHPHPLTPPTHPPLSLPPTPSPSHAPPTCA